MQRAKMTNAKKQLYENPNDAFTCVIIVKPKEGKHIALNHT
ncbi:hypothetical protein WG954_11750 [Lacibacter sp. H375]